MCTVHVACRIFLYKFWEEHFIFFFLHRTHSASWFKTRVGSGSHMNQSRMGAVRLPIFLIA